MGNWQDVLRNLPLPLRAADGENGIRRAELRIWKVPAATEPIVLQARLYEDDRPVEQWTHRYAERAAKYAHSACDDWTDRLTKWIDGRGQLHYLRPRCQHGYFVRGTPIG